MFRKLNAGTGGAATKATNMKLDKILEKLRWRAGAKARDLIFIHMRVINVCGIKGEWNDFATLVRCDDVSKVWFELPARSASFWKNSSSKRKLDTDALYKAVAEGKKRSCDYQS